MISKQKKKICFVISPIGDDNTAIRIRSDKILKHIIRPAMENYTIIRADNISESGSITRQVIEYLLSADIVIADLSGHNPNVFYELAVRHMIKKPFIQLIEKGEPLPFDIKDIRTISIGEDVEIANQAIAMISEQLKEIEQNRDIDNPMTILWNKIVEEFAPYVALSNIEKDVVYNGHKFTLFRTRDSMIEYFDVMWNNAKKGDEIWAQGVGHTSYTPNMVEKLQKLIDRGVSVKIIVNGHSDHKKEFVDKLDKVPLVQKRIATNNTVRLHGLSHKEVIISLPATEAPYEAFVIKDEELTKALKQCFDARFNRIKKTTL